VRGSDASSPTDQLLEEISALLQRAEVRQALQARQGELVLSWASGHVTYLEMRPRYKVGVDVRLETG
jgi:hypothetical protein